jgi:hypothetical protein
MLGRMTGTEGTRRAARYLASQMATIGLTPAGDSGYLQRIPIDVTSGPVATWTAFNALPAAKRLVEANVVGLLEGSNPVMRDSVILVDAHYDHLGIQHGASGDSIFNGADGDASGVTTVHAVARALAAGSVPIWTPGGRP